MYFNNNLALANILQFLRFSFFVRNLTISNGQKIAGTKKKAILELLQITMQQKKNYDVIIFGYGIII